jgi:AcrR family transcriptional regulator
MTKEKWNGQITCTKERRAAKLQAILNVAAAAFLEKGYHKTSLDDIAQRQNVTKPTLYYYIKNKEDILIKCENQAMEKINALLDRTEALAEDGFQKLQNFIAGYVDLVMDDIIRCHIQHRGQMKTPEAKENSLQNHRDIEHRVRKIIASAISDHSMRSCNPTIIAILLFDSINGISAWYREGGSVNKEVLKAEVLNLLTGGLAA